MINLLVGPPGGGKSYEAVAYHVLPALAAGRRVITTLPLNLDYFAMVNPEYLALIDVRLVTRKERPAVDWVKAEGMFKKIGIAQKQNSPFAHAEDYGDLWRHPETGSGPLYVVDECHIPLPSRGTEMEVEHWYSLHRHESADVLLMTQSYGKINLAIRDLVQICYKVKKNTAFGSANSYVRKVQDGIRGEVVNTSIRKYEKKFFPFYKSHTKGGGSELAAQDIVPFWRRWPILGSGIMFLIFFVMLFSGMLKNPMKPKVQDQSESNSVSPVLPSAHVLTASSVSSPSQVQSVSSSSQAPVAQPQKPAATDPFSAYGLHIVGHIKNVKKDLWIFSLSQNGQKLKNIYSSDLVAVGYGFQAIGDCAAWISFQGEKRFLTCDSPSITVASASAPGAIK
jgi:zona occludens toxin